MSQVLVINSGSSSLKFKLFDALNFGKRLVPVASGLVERIGDTANSRMVAKCWSPDPTVPAPDLTSDDDVLKAHDVLDEKAWLSCLRPTARCLSSKWNNNLLAIRSTARADMSLQQWLYRCPLAYKAPDIIPCPAQTCAEHSEHSPTSQDTRYTTSCASNEPCEWLVHPPQEPLSDHTVALDYVLDYLRRARSSTIADEARHLTRVVLPDPCTSGSMPARCAAGLPA